MAIKALLAGGRAEEPFYPNKELQKIEKIRSAEGEEAAEKYKKDKATGFDLRMFSARERCEIMGLVRSNQEGRAIYQSLRHGIVGWSNLLHPKTKDPVKFEGEKDGLETTVGATVEDVDAIPADLMIELWSELAGLCDSEFANFLA